MGNKAPNTPTQKLREEELKEEKRLADKLIKEFAAKQALRRMPTVQDLKPKKQRRKSQNKEHKMQAAFMRYKRDMSLLDWRWKNIYANCNAGKRSPIMASYFKAEGLEAGVPDITVALPSVVGSVTYHGLYIELKVDNRKSSDIQKDWQQRLKKAGYLCFEINEDLAGLIKLVEKYIKHCPII